MLIMALNSFFKANAFNFDQLGLETLALTPLEQELSDLAHKQSLKTTTYQRFANRCIMFVQP